MLRTGKHRLIGTRLNHSHLSRYMVRRFDLSLGVGWSGPVDRGQLKRSTGDRLEIGSHPMTHNTNAHTKSTGAQFLLKR